TNERFDLEGFVKANEAYPLNWQIKVIRVIEENDSVVSLVEVKTADDPGAPSFYASSFFEFENEKIKYLTENWGENGSPPQWRVDLNISTPIGI
ncbi:MAG TPA: hypothetical protein DIT04_08120, partial [Dysgonomonas sp.]|nr:hypothetical protein [Dysgonomonas sp.]